jgi:hypothetical protein
VGPPRRRILPEEGAGEDAGHSTIDGRRRGAEGEQLHSVASIEAATAEEILQVSGPGWNDAAVGIAEPQQDPVDALDAPWQAERGEHRTQRPEARHP